MDFLGWVSLSQPWLYARYEVVFFCLIFCLPRPWRQVEALTVSFISDSTFHFLLDGQYFHILQAAASKIVIYQKKANTVDTSNENLINYTY